MIMSGTIHINRGLDESYELTGCAYQELDNSSRELENTYDVVISSNIAKLRGCTTKVGDGHDVKKHCSAERTIVPKCLVATLAIAICIAVMSLITAVTALIVAVTVLTNDQASSQVVTTATSSIDQIIQDRLSE